MQYGILHADMTSYNSPTRVQNTPMQPTLRFSVLLATAFILGACAAGDLGGYGSQSERRAEALARNSQHADAAAAYIGLASAQQGIERDPIPSEPAHCAVFGKKTQPIKNRFAEVSVWVISPLASLVEEKLRPTS